MKIMHIIPNLSSGGAERMLSKLVTKDDQHTHIIVTLLEGSIHYNLEGTKIIQLNRPNIFTTKIIVLKDLIKLIKREDINLVQTWSKCNYYGPLLKYCFPDIKIVSNFRNGYNGQNNLFITAVLNFILKKFDGNIFVSKSALQERINANLLFTNVKIINNGFEVPSNIKPSNNSFVIGHIGRFHPVKNQINIVKAFHDFSKEKEVKLVMAGKDLNFEKLNIPEAMNPKISYLGEISNVTQFYEDIDILVMASKSEGFPNVIGEAMSYGKYIICTNAGESHEIIGELGYKLQDGNVSTINKAFEFVYSNSYLLEEERTKNYTRILNNYSLDIIIKQYQDYYKSLGV